MVPSRSRKTARWARLDIERGPHRARDRLDLIGEDGAGIEQHAVVADARDDGRVAGAEACRQGVRGQGSGAGGQANEPALQFRSRKRAAADLGLTFDELRTGAYGFL